MLVTLWRGLGWYMVLYLAGLQAIPKEIEEAAVLDGANAMAALLGRDDPDDRADDSAVFGAVDAGGDEGA